VRKFVTVVLTNVKSMQGWAWNTVVNVLNPAVIVQSFVPGWRMQHKCRGFDDANSNS